MCSPRYVLWDWHGVLGTKGFWYRSALSNPEIARFVEYAFENSERMVSWMRGSLTVEDLLQASGARVTRERLESSLIEDMSQDGAVNVTLQCAIRQLYPDTEQIIVTDNMDIFTAFTTSSGYIKRAFSQVFNSAETRCLKDDSPGLFEHVLGTLGLDSYAQCLLFDDSHDNCKRFEALGGTAILIGKDMRWITWLPNPQFDIKVPPVLSR